MASTLWYDAPHDRLLTAGELRTVRGRAAQIYEANPRFFADELEVLRSLGVLPLLDAIRMDLVTLRSHVAA